MTTVVFGANCLSVMYGLDRPPTSVIWSGHERVEPEDDQKIPHRIYSSRPCGRVFVRRYGAAIRSANESAAVLDILRKQHERKLGGL